MRSLAPDKERQLGLVARRVVPDLALADAGTEARFLTAVDEALGERPETVRRQVAAFLGLIRLAPLLRFGRTFDRLDSSRQDRVLRWLQECPVGLLQKGFWGLRTIIFMGWYSQEERWPELGYEPVADGNQRLDAERRRDA
jgi:hypothetical protein